MSGTARAPVWFTEEQVRMLHAEALRLFGGAAGVRDEGLLQSALGRRRHLWTYDERATLFDLAAAYAFGLAKNHAFVDGNERVALLPIRAFLYRSGFRFHPDEVETVTTMEGVAGGSVSERDLAVWIRANAGPSEV